MGKSKAILGIWFISVCCLVGLFSVSRANTSSNFNDAGNRNLKYFPNISPALADKHKSRDASSGLNLVISQIDSDNLDAVKMSVRVTDNLGNYILGLDNDSFSVTEDGVSITADVTMSGSSHEPFTAVLVMDTSGSMGSSEMNAAIDGAKQYVESMGIDDRTAIVVYSSYRRTKVLQSFTSDKTQLSDALDTIYSSGLTAMYKGTYIALEELINEASSLKAVFVYTDGHENDSCGTPAYLAYAGEESDYGCSASVYNYIDQFKKQHPVPIYGIAVGANAATEYLENMVNSDPVGAVLTAPSASDLSALYNETKDAVESEYMFSYASPNPTRDGSSRCVNIELNYNSDVVTAEICYDAPACPVITRTDHTKALEKTAQPQNASLSISAIVTDSDDNITQATLFYRNSDTQAFQQTEMLAIGNDTYELEIPADEVIKGSIQYYIQASDTDGSVVTAPLEFAIQDPYDILIDNNAPVIEDIVAPEKPKTADEDMMITARISDPDGDEIADPVIHWRAAGSYFYVKVPMNLQSSSSRSRSTTDDIYIATFPTNDEAVENGIEFFITAKDSYDSIGQEGSAITPVQSNSLQTSWIAYPVGNSITLDGVITSEEWSIAAERDISNIGGIRDGIVQTEGTVKVYALYDQNYLWIAVDSSNDTNEDAMDQIGIYIDTNADNLWPAPDASEFEGNWWLVSGGNDPDWTAKRGMFWDGSDTSFDTVIYEPAEFMGNVTDSSGNVQYEARFDLTALNNITAGDSIKIWIYSLNYPDSQFAGWWPQDVLNEGNRSGWQNSLYYGQLSLSEVAGITCAYTLSTASVEFDSNGGIQDISINVSDENCSWTVSEDIPWVDVSPTNGTGNGSVTLTVVPNTGSARSGIVTIGGEEISVSQANTPTSQKAILTDLPLTIAPYSYYHVYGSILDNVLTIGKGAWVKMVNFPGNNTIYIESDPSFFTVHRSGTIIIFEGTDGTMISMPATTTHQTISFNDIIYDLVISAEEVTINGTIVTNSTTALQSFD